MSAARSCSRRLFWQQRFLATTTAWASSSSSSQEARHVMMVATAAAAVGLTLLSSSSSSNNNSHKTYNHCQVPCGIFDDPGMVMELQQAVMTIRKAMAQTQALVGSSSTAETTLADEALAVNQAVRWINVKEEHASKIITLVAEYCLCQRVKRPLFATDEEYWQALQTHHMVMQAAMKTKQSVSPIDVDALQVAVMELAKMYTPAET